jgi:hypothetical protein
VCRLSLEFDVATDKLTTTPLEVDHHVEPAAPRVRVLPAPVANLRKKSPVKAIRAKAKQPKLRHK